MKKTLLATLAAATVIGSAGAANAATTCITKYLTGVWVGSAGASDDNYCIVEFKSNGWVIQASCFDKTTLKSVGTWDGRFTSDKQCNISGNFDVIPKKGKKFDVVFTGKLNPKTGVMTGSAKTAGQPATDYNLIQQWN